MSEPRLRIGVVCYPTFGGSGIVATEIAEAMAERGHEVHVLSTAPPVRLRHSRENLRFHQVGALEYPLLEPGGSYAIALASKLVDVAMWAGLDVVHAHYAVPHATSAWMAREVLGDRRFGLVTTLHGTDITLVGSDPSFQPITRFSIEKSDIVTTPSQFLRVETAARLGVHRPGTRAAPSSERDPTEGIVVIPNFVDVERYCPRPLMSPGLPAPAYGARDWGHAEALLVHASNFRPVKRIMDVMAIFGRVVADRPCRLVMVGDGPERQRAESWARDRGLASRVCFLGRQEEFVDVLQQASAFLLPSESESFGLAALEAMACGVPVVASRVGGLPEVIEDGVSGVLETLGDTDAHAKAVLSLLDSPERMAAMRVAARQRVLDRFQPGPVLDAYEALYQAAAGKRALRPGS
ncbi:MAG: N-acetyl-alpha-D-glucosaminyl L-malate synthase BshA [Myxococcales bacterium]|nr:N-acetyl-alpha-D-glucosaminyl L-malate synthase BshA [Myxococcales bacterium]